MARSTRSLAVCAVIAIGALVTLTAPAAPVGADAGTRFTGASGATGARPLAQPGGAGLGDPYFPKDGNGGYDVAHYNLDVGYFPRLDRLHGVATITARATQRLSRFNLDLDGMFVRSVYLRGQAGPTWSRGGGELRIAPRHHLRDGERFTVVVRYTGVPRTIGGGLLGGEEGFVHTDDGALVAGQPHVAATWFPVNDHPSDKASYTFEVTVPRGLTAVANGRLAGQQHHGDRTTWTWQARAPMASYLATATIGDFDLRSYRSDGRRNWDAIDPDLFDPWAVPRTGSQLAISQRSDLSYKRLSRVIDVPAGGGRLSFWLSYDTEPTYDFVFVEARTVGENDWTTLPDENGHTSRSTGGCPYLLDLYPFLRHYQTPTDDGCRARGTTGQWWAAEGAGGGWQRWSHDLTRYAGSRVRVSITYASDDVFQYGGTYVDDVRVSAGSGPEDGTTSFEADADTLDGWSTPGPPPGSEPNPNDWVVGTVDDEPPSFGEVAEQSLARQGEILAFLATRFGPYPFNTAGGIVDYAPEMTFALENQTRPIYSPTWFYNRLEGDSVVVHELTHQWYGDSLGVNRWRHIWLNEGFATYAEWLWSAREGRETPQELFDFYYQVIPAGSPFWAVRIGNPGPDLLFDQAIYLRGAMALHQLRRKIGDQDFFTTMKRWSRSQAGGLVATSELIDLAERVSGQDLDRLFRTWVFTPAKPQLSGPAARTGAGPQPVPLSVSPQILRSLASYGG